MSGAAGLGRADSRLCHLKRWGSQGLSFSLAHKAHPPLAPPPRKRLSRAYGPTLHLVAALTLSPPPPAQGRPGAAAQAVLRAQRLWLEERASGRAATALAWARATVGLSGHLAATGDDAEAERCLTEVRDFNESRALAHLVATAAVGRLFVCSHLGGRHLGAVAAMLQAMHLFFSQTAPPRPSRPPHTFISAMRVAAPPPLPTPRFLIFFSFLAPFFLLFIRNFSLFLPLLLPGHRPPRGPAPRRLVSGPCRPRGQRRDGASGRRGLRAGRHRPRRPPCHPGTRRPGALQRHHGRPAPRGPARLRRAVRSVGHVR